MEYSPHQWWVGWQQIPIHLEIAGGLGSVFALVYDRLPAALWSNLSAQPVYANDTKNT